MTTAEEFFREQGVDVTSMNWRSLTHLSPENLMTDLHLRHTFIAKFGFAVLTTTVVEALRPYAPYLEIGAGSGYWSYELLRAGINVIATDPGTGHYRDLPKGWTSPWTPVERLSGVSATRKYPDRALLIVWPDYKASWPAKTLAASRCSTVVYVGEGDGGCTANTHFHKMLDKRFSLKEEITIPQFPGIHDTVMIYSRR